MSPTLARPLLHTAHLVTFVVLLASGALLLLPELRAAITGGYSLAIRQTHRWAGVAFVVLPAAIIAVGGMGSVFGASVERTAHVIWQQIHVAITIFVSALLTVTGFAIWGQGRLSERLVDSSFLLHDWLTYAAAALLIVHLLDAGLAALFSRFHAASAVAAKQRET